MDSLDSKVAVITGAASGIGLALAREFGHQGMRVVLSDVSEERLDNAVRPHAGSLCTKVSKRLSWNPYGQLIAGCVSEIRLSPRRSWAL